MVEENFGAQLRELVRPTTGARWVETTEAPPPQVASSRDYVLLCCDDSLYYNDFNIGCLASSPC